MTASRHSAFMKGGGGLQTAVAPLRRSGAAPVFAMFAVATVVSLALALPAAAREITAVEAAKAASSWVGRDRSPMGETMGSSNVAEVRTTRGDDGTPLFHVVRMEGGGTVVTSAESGIRPVIAFFDGDGVPEDPDHPLFAILCADLAKRTRETLAVRTAAESETEEETESEKEEAEKTGSAASSDAGAGVVSLRYAAASGESPFRAEEAEWNALLGGDSVRKTADSVGTSSVKYGVSGVSDVRVAKLLSTAWGQSSGAANYYTPPYEAGNASNYVCGCVALAGAQIAKYWGFPTASRPKVTRTCYVSGSSVSKTSMGETYAWSDMPNSFSGMTTAQKQAVGKLCYDFGVATYMNWDSEGSGTGGYCLADAFCTVFGYANSRTQVQDGGAFSADVVQRAVLANLDAKCPVSLGIDGHQVVADGYGYSSGTLYTHVNLGWEGGADAWYDLPTVDTTSMGYDYASTVLDEVVYNIFPQKTGDLLTGRVLDKNGRPVSGAAVKAVNGSATATATTDGHGVYALWVTGGKPWTVTVSFSGAAASRTVSVASSVSTTVETKYYYPDTGSVGNSWGNDLTLAGVTVPELTLADALDNAELVFVTGGDAAWMPQIDETHDGAGAARSGVVSDGQSSWLQTTVTGPGTLSFWWNVSSESAENGYLFDYLEFSVDGTRNAKIGGTSAAWEQKTVPVSGSGAHVFKWNYRKDNTWSAGSDCGWVDQIVWTPADPAAVSGMAFDPASGIANVSFRASPGISYCIQRAPSLDGPWTTVKTVAPPSSGTVEADVSMPTSWASGFLRVVPKE